MSVPNSPTGITIEQAQVVARNHCDVCGRQFRYGDQILVRSLDPKAPPEVLASRCSGLWSNQIVYHTHTTCSKREALH